MYMDIGPMRSLGTTAHSFPPCVSRRAYQLLSWQCGRLNSICRVPLFVEYEAVAIRFLHDSSVTEQDLADILDYVCAANLRQVLWRPFCAATRIWY